MRAEELQYADVVILKLAGRVDQETSASLQARLQELIGRLSPPHTVGLVLDLAGVPYMSSAGLRALMVGAKESKAKGSKLAIAALQPVVREVFHISRFDKVIATYGEVHEAVGAISPAAVAALNARHPV